MFSPDKTDLAPEIIQKVESEGFNPYFGVPKVCEVEEKFGIRSSFYFRPLYDDGSPVAEYSQTLRTLRHTAGKWAYTLTTQPPKRT